MYKFQSRKNAFSFANRCLVPMWVLLGDDEMFWVVTPAKAAKLFRQGYESAR